MTATFQRRLEALYGLERRKNKLGLDGTRALLRALGDPHTRFRSVHVAGTNGKGSVCALVERVLREAGLRTGLFTSPHLVDFRERIRVRGRWVDEDWLEQALDRIEALPEGRDRTFFEIATALGFLYFAEQGVEIAVVEVGLGGRLDCTNVLAPEVTVITPIGLDHQEILGHTLEEIAAEKAGILKPGAAVVTEERGASRRVIDARAARLSVRHAAPPDPAWLERLSTMHARIRPALRHQTSNAVVALGELARRGIPVPWPAIERGLVHARWPGRWESCPTLPRLWWDGAHNPSAVLHQRARIHALAPRAVVLAFSRDKDVHAFLRVLRSDDPPATIVATRSHSERAVAPADIAAAARAVGFGTVEAPDVASAVHRALELAGDAPVLLTGSLFAVGDAMEAFGGAPGEML